VANTTKTSLFKDIKFPGAVSTRATKYKDMANEGDQWHCPVFDLGSAKPSSNLPTAKKISRKSPHDSKPTINESSQGVNKSSTKYGDSNKYGNGKTGLDRSQDKQFSKGGLSNKGYSEFKGQNGSYSNGHTSIPSGITDGLDTRYAKMPREKEALYPPGGVSYTSDPPTI